MSKPLKNLISNELKSQYGEIDSAVVFNILGLDANTTVEFRRDLRKKNIRVQMIKNSLAKRAFKDTPLERIGEVLSGSCALATGGDSIVDVARDIVEWSKKYEVLEVRGAVVEGEVLDASDAKELAKMLTRPELIGEVVALANSPGARIAGAIGSPASTIAGCIKTLQEKLEEAA